MAGEWTTFRLGDICSKIGSGATPRGGSSVYLRGGSVALIRSQNVYNDAFYREGLVYLTEEHADGLANVEVREHDVLLNITGDSVARSCQVATDILPARVNQHVAIIRPDPSKLSPQFLQYFLVSRSMQTKLLALAGAGATRNALTKSMIENLEIDAPEDVEEQRAIAHILGTLDDKIELNRRMNETLEEMARAIFKSWFVDFDPVRAKAEGRDTGLLKHISDLFPDRFEDSELGEIPAGWGVSVLDHYTDFVIGGDWGVAEPTEDNTEKALCIRGADIPSLQVGGRGKMPTRFIKSASFRKRQLDAGDLVIEISGGSPTQSTGRPVLVSQQLLDRLASPLICSNFCRLLKLKMPNTSMFIYLWLRSAYASDEFLQFENGTTGIKNFAFKLFSANYELVAPPSKILETFDQTISPFFEQQQANAAASDSLAAIRDALLPRLISGELRVLDAKRILGNLSDG